jgi:hypothetical protein
VALFHVQLMSVFMSEFLTRDSYASCDYFLFLLLICLFVYLIYNMMLLSILGYSSESVWEFIKDK